MKTDARKHGLFILVIILLFVTCFIFYLNIQKDKRQLTFAMLDVGQGDAIFIESPTGTQILFDSGPPGRILSKLSRVMPMFDRTIDAIVITNPDADHIAGFLDVLKVYKVGQVFEAGTFNDSKMYENLQNEIKKQNIKNTLAKDGTRMHLGGGAVIDILFPDRDVYLWTPNDGSIIARLSYGETSIMLTGDATSDTEEIVLRSYPKSYLQSDVLKVGHHGSRTSTSFDFTEAIAPSYALISSGEGNSYGHPHVDVLDTLASFGTEILRTDMMGTIILKSDGQDFKFSFQKQKCDTINLCKTN